MLDKLKKVLKTKGLDMFIVVSSDEHMNEYPPKHNLRLKAATGFSGSAGTAIICAEGRSQLFVDSRYHLQAEQTCSEHFEIQKLGNENVLSPHAWLAEQQEKILKIAADPFVMSHKIWKKFQTNIENSDHVLVATHPNLIDELWEDRPVPLKNPVYPLPSEYTDKSSESKLADVRQAMSKTKAADGINPDVLLVSQLDDIAWLLNLRGSDVAYNPVFEAYAAIFQDQAICFCHHPEAGLEKLCPGWEFRPYEAYHDLLAECSANQEIKVWLDPDSITMGTRQAFSDTQVYESDSPISLAKAVKCPAEIKAITNAHLQAGAAVSRSFRKLHETLENNQSVTEKQFSDSLYEEYSKAEGFKDLSFGTISGAGPNGAIVHYGTPEEKLTMPKNSLLLVDSGIQCLGGTTDATRTVLLGESDDKQAGHYTLVLKAHINLARQIFPEGTKGSALDAITRSTLWNSGLDYGHGTGHGVGAFLNVHEGPQNLSPSSHKVALEQGMVVSIEPGYYEIGWGGIRLENLYVVQEATDLPLHPGGKKWLRFEALTLIPWERRLINVALLNTEELAWLIDYHEHVYQQIYPLLDQDEDQQWLRWACEVK